MTIEELLPKVKKNVLLGSHTTFRIGGFADYFFEATTKEEIIKGIKAAKEVGIPFFVLGNGSNVLISDEGFRGLVIKTKNDAIDKKRAGVYEIGAGALLSRVYAFCLENELGGLEWSVGIPASLGGSIIGNAGAFKKSMADSVVSVEVYDTEKDEVKKIEKNDCGFNYRTSFFKEKLNYVVLGAELKFKKKNKSDIRKEGKEFLRQRLEKQPEGFSVGSVFKNYVFKNEKEKQELMHRYPEIKKIIQDGAVPAGFIIDKCKLKGEKIGGAKISEQHANFIINFNDAEAEDVKKLLNLIKQEAYKRMRIHLEEEIKVF